MYCMIKAKLILQFADDYQSSAWYEPEAPVCQNELMKAAMSIDSFEL